MVLAKRKRSASISSIDSDDNNSVGFDPADSDDEMAMDISSALTGKPPKDVAQGPALDEDDGDEDLANFIKNSITKRDIKQGTEIIKKTKGKANIAKGEVGGGSFQSMGLHPSLLRSLTLQGYRIPTPIQRLSIPSLLENPPRDLVGMARTGSGKSLAYMIPLVQRLGGCHQTAFGARALILLPTRELAVQILKVGKELARGWHSKGDHAGDRNEAESSRGQALRWGLVVGGEGMDEQFEMITNNPDIIIATPGRLLHLVVEMNLDLKSIQYVVFDEADRLFEMGFETAMTELIHRLPTSRQTLLFSATLPKSLVEFAKAGLQDPKLVRLDSESKISSDLKMAFFSVKQAEKEACLLTLLRDVIKVPLGENKPDDEEKDKKKSLRKAKIAPHALAPHQTLIFAATKHHIEYLTNLLTTVGYSVSHIYGSLDQVARSMQMDRFRRGLTNILVVTDVAARGIDIPVLQNVVNYDFPQGARVFVHRVGRTARAGRPGWAWSLVTNSELPYLLDLQLFLARPLVNDVLGDGDHFYTENLVLGTFQRETLDEELEYIRSLDEANHSLPTLKQVMIRGHTLYERSKGKASPQSYKRAKEMLKDPKWLLAGSDSSIHPVLLRGSDAGEKRKLQQARTNLLRAVNSFTPSETIFEASQKATSENLALMKQRRKALGKSIQRSQAAAIAAKEGDSDEEDIHGHQSGDVEMAGEEDIAAVFHTDKKKSGYRDENFYMSYTPKDADTERGYSLNDGASSFVKQAQSVAFDLEGDEGDGLRKRNNTLTWDKKKKKFIKGDGSGADNVKMIRTESGAKLPATYRSGRFDEWKAKNRVSLPHIGEAEQSSGGRNRSFGGRKFKHIQVTVPKALDKLDKNYERKLKKRKEKESTGDEDGATSQTNKKGPAKGKPTRRHGGKSYGKVKTELKTVDQIRRDRKTQEQRRAKNARPSKKKGRR